uniref:Retrovirus-related Pol polyprotein from transposon 17.6 n=1 Tax=Cajanus cajan TaxID=3821 RepID=A0A151RMX9_CAJCA|nr:Retrovirus-related Pol polyprotein from transposon 17.6 [Cajanus cajan]
MAPPKTRPEKRIKTTVARPFRGPSFDSHTFHDKELQEFYPKLEERSLWMEKMVKLKPTEYPEFQAKIQRRKWEKLAYYMAPANISVVREFYCNARVLSNDFPEYASYVRDIMIRFDATINTFLGTHLTEGLRYYEYSDWVARSKNYRLVERMVCKPGKGFQYTSRGKISHILREDLIPMAKVWVAFIHANLSPCCHTSDVLESRALLLYAIMDRKAIDVGALIAEEIRHCSQHTGILGHPSLITHLCHRSRVDVTETPFEKLKMPINKVYIDTYYYKETNRRTASTSASSSRAPPPVSDMESRRWEDINVALLRNEQRDEAMFRAITMVMDSVRDLSIHAPGLALNFHPSSAAAYSAHVAWPGGLAQQQGEAYYCFLDGYSGYNQIAVNPEDQEKTAFTCPFGVFAYRRMPFGLCNAPATFQRCMLAIFADLVEKCIEVFMDDFSVFGSSYDVCLENLELVLKRCIDTNLVLNWEKCHFMVQEGIVLGHQISARGIEVDKAKVDVIEKLPPPINVKGVRSFLGHAGFYRRFIKDFSKIAKPLCTLLNKEQPFLFDEECMKAFLTLKNKLTTTPVIVAPDWSESFELMCDANDYAVGAVLGQQRNKVFHSIYYASKVLTEA